MILEKIGSPADLKQLDEEQLPLLASEIRQKIIETVSRNGGHLASNLGIVELTIAIHRVFDVPHDKLIFDVGHQCYVHKLLTDRTKDFETLRTYDGISGFPKRDESPFDVFETGHASTAISAALGFARARDYRKENSKVIAVVGDGAMTGGMCYEALNDAGNSHTPMLVILNDNEMSISKNVGALSVYLTKLRISRRYQATKQHVRSIKHVPFIGKSVYSLIHRAKNAVKSIFVKQKNEGFFEALGFRYFGPIDGHDILGLEEILKEASDQAEPTVVHVITQKGRGYDQAENSPETFHGTPPFYVETGSRLKEPDSWSFGHVMAQRLVELADTHPEIVAVTAAMPMGTGLDHFKEKYPERMIDVGIAEEHAVTMAAGMAAAGMRPYFAVYAPFFQRCFDQVIHDVCMQNLPVVFLLDRAGIGSADGKTHHGVFDLAQTLPIPGLTVLSPADADELRKMIDWTLTQNGPCVIRYARYQKTFEENISNGPFTPGVWKVLTEGKDCTLVTYGTSISIASETSKLLSEKGVSAGIINASSIKPVDHKMLSCLKNPWFTIEEHVLNGGFGAYLTRICNERSYHAPSACFGIDDQFLSHGDHPKLLKDADLSPEILAEKILCALGRS